MKIGFIGLGNMGSGMANNILEKIDDKSNLFVYTRTPEKIAKIIYDFSGCFLDKWHAAPIPDTPAPMIIISLCILFISKNSNKNISLKEAF